MAPAMAPHIYAELLPHIRRMSLVVSLPTPATHFTKAGLTPDGKRAYIYHERVTYEIILPGTSNKKGELLGGLLKEGNLQVSWRIVWDQAEAGKFQEALQDASATGVGLGVIPPWSATELGGGAMVLCRGCGATIVDAGKVECWKDLPSENWAEMMEFWHCHKPADKPAGKENEKPEETDDAVAINGGATNRDATNGDKVEGDKLAARGYGANSVITARKGVGFVDLMTILFSGEDYQGLTVRIPSHSIALHHHGYQEGIQAGPNPPNGMATDTSTLDRIVLSRLCLVQATTEACETSLCRWGHLWIWWRGRSTLHLYIPS